MARQKSIYTLSRTNSLPVARSWYSFRKSALRRSSYPGFGGESVLEPDVLHSGLSDTARLSAWRAARDGSAQLIVGTRSAIFVPLKNPGLIIVDEEHDSSLKQQEGLRYSARDLAVVRAKKLDIPVVLGSATPSLETLQRCRDGAYKQIRLPSRAGKAVPPLMRLVDLTRFDAYEGLSQPVIDAIEKNIAQDGQVLIFLNRRGFAPTLICSGCGSIAECVALRLTNDRARCQQFALVSSLWCATRNRCRMY